MANWTDYEIQETKIGVRNKSVRIFYRGSLTPELFKKSLAVVGSRRMTRYGMEVIEKFIPALVAERVTIISGFMYGVDTSAHAKTVEYGGRTVAVFGSGINICYPPENDKLYIKILETGGVVMSEYKPDQKSQLWMYPARNKIVAGLSTLGVLVIEAGEDSGSLITAKLAKQMGKKVYAVPGPITSSVSAGVNSLIKSGIAKLVTSPSDIVAVSPITNHKSPVTASDHFENKIIELLKLEPLTVDELAAKLGKSVVGLSGKLSLMALAGKISESGGKFYVVS